MKRIYLDGNATTPLDPRVAEAMLQASRDVVGNPSSQHWAGRQARRLLEECREKIGVLLGARMTGRDKDRVIFTSGGTECNNWILRAFAAADSQIVLSGIEHPSLAQAAAALAAEGRVRIVQVPPEPTGEVRVEQFVGYLQPPTRLVCLMLANNETGVLQPVSALAAVARQRGIAVYTDAVQAVGKIPVDFQQLGVTCLAAAAHKFHGPVGIGVLLVRSSVRLAPMLYGGAQQHGWRPGTESVLLAIGMCRALELFQAEASERYRRWVELRHRFEHMLRSAIPDLVIIGQDARRLPNTSHVVFPGCDRQALFLALDARGIACSIGSACASGSSEPSPVLAAMGLPQEWIQSAIRFSLTAFTTEDEIQQAVPRIADAVEQVRRAMTVSK